MRSLPKRAVQGFLLAVFMLALMWGETLWALGTAVTPTRFVPGDTAVGPATGTQLAPAISHGNGTSLAVWSDQRAQATSVFYEFETSSDIYGILLDANGNPLSTLPFPIAQGKASQTSPRVAWNGTNWLVVFETTVLSGTGYYYEQALAAVRVSATGQVLDTEPIRLYNTPTVGSLWSLAGMGQDWVLVYQANDLLALKITAGGQVQQPATILVPATYYLRFNPQLACTSSTCLLTFNDLYVNGLNTTGAVRFDSSFNVLGSGVVTLLDRPLDDLVSNGTGFYAVWNQQLPDFSTAVYGSRIDLNGVMLDGAGDNISLTNAPATGTGPIAGWDGTNWRVSWRVSFFSDTTLYTARISSAGQVLTPGGIAVTGATLGETAVTNNGGLQMVRSVYNGNEEDVRTTYISAANVAGPEKTLSLSQASQTRPTAAVGSNGYMLVYHSDYSDSYRVVAQPLDANGNPLTTEPILIESGTTQTSPGTPTVAWNGSVYLISWANNSGIVARRIQQDGTLVDPAPIFVMPGFGPPEVAPLGNTFLVAGRRYGSTPQFIDAYVARVDGVTGTVLDSPPRFVGGLYVRSLSLTTLGNRWFLAYHSNWSHDNPLGQTGGAFIDANGAVNPSFLVYGYYSSSGGNGVFRVAAAASDNAILVVQSAELTSGVETDLVGVLVNSDGTTQPPVNLTPWLGNQYNPDLAWDGSQFVLAYNEQRNRFAPLTLDQLDARGDLYGMRISASGTVIDPQGFIFSNSPLGEVNPRVTAVNGISLFTGSLIKNEAAAYRVGYQQYGVGGNKWPVAVAGASVLGGNVPFTVNFNANGSTDPDGTIVSYHWDFGDGATSTLANPSHAYTVPGEYVALLTVTDNLGITTSNAVAITAQAPNINPVAFISANLTSGPAPLSVEFSSVGSYDPDGSVGNVEWNFGDGTPNNFGPNAYHTYSAEGSYTATVTVFDGRGGSGTASLVINVGAEPPNQPPTAVAEVNVATGPAPFNPFFSSANSTDPDGFITDWLWDFGDGTTSNVPHPAIKTYTQPGTYLVTLTVTDNDGARDSDTILITVTGTAENVPPVAIASATPDSGPAPLVVRFNSSSSYDPDGTIVSYLWQLSDGRSSTRSDPRFRFSTNGVYTAVLTVSDNRGATGTATVTITVGSTPTNQPPAAVAAATPSSGTAPLTVSFNGSGSTDSDGTIVAYAWDFGDGATAAGVTAAHTYTTPGTYLVTLSVTDDDSAVGTDTVSITVSPDGGACSANCLVVSDIRLQGRNRRGTVTLTARVTVTNETGGTLAGVSVSAAWTLPDGTIQNQVLTTDSRGQANFALTSGQTGTYTLSVTDLTLAGYTFDPDNSILTASITP